MTWPVFRYTRNQKLERIAEIMLEILVLACNKCQGDTMTSVQMVLILFSEWICKIIISWCHCRLINKQNFVCHALVLIGFICTIYRITISILMTFYFHLGVIMYLIHASVYGVQFLVKLRNYYVIDTSIDRKI